MTWQKLLTLCRGGMVNVCLHAKLLLTAAHRQFVVISPSERKYGRISICNATNTHRKMAEKVGRLSFLVRERSIIWHFIIQFYLGWYRIHEFLSDSY